MTWGSSGLTCGTGVFWRAENLHSAPSVMCLLAEGDRW